jgi:hypothetical protein
VNDLRAVSEEREADISALETLEDINREGEREKVRAFRGWRRASEKFDLWERGILLALIAVVVVAPVETALRSGVLGLIAFRLCQLWKAPRF